MKYPIRILHIVTTMNRGGLETMLMNYYRHIDHSKVQFDFLVHRDFEADYDKEIISLGGKIYHISRLIPWSKEYKNRLKEFFKSHPEYKIVHVHQDCLSSVALRCAKECGIPVRIAHSHNSNQDKNWKYLFKLYYMKKIPTYATDFFACGKMAGEWMFNGNDFHIINNAIETKKYLYSEDVRLRKRKEFGICHELVLGHVGRFFPQKNHKFLIEIFAEVLKYKPDAKLLLVGDGEGKKEVLEQVNALGLTKHVIFAGVRTDVNELMQAMDIFVFPSLYEGLPVTMIEAQAAGLHCLISDTVSSECIITNDLISIKKITEPVSEWAKKIIELADYKRIEHFTEIKEAGYDVEENAKWLQKFYISKYEE